MKIAVLASGSGTNLQALIDQLHQDENSGVEIAVVISDRRKAYALTRAKEAGIPTHVVRVRDFPNRDAFDAEIAKILDRYGVELIVLAGFMKLFSAGVCAKVPQPHHQYSSIVTTCVSGRALRTRYTGVWC